MSDIELIEIIPENIPKWAIKAMAHQVLFKITFERIAKLESMCLAAAREIEEHWEEHCDDKGYGPVNLISRLKGDLPPDYY